MHELNYRQQYSYLLLLLDYYSQKENLELLGNRDGMHQLHAYYELKID